MAFIPPTSHATYIQPELNPPSAQLPQPVSGTMSCSLQEKATMLFVMAPQGREGFKSKEQIMEVW